MEKKPLVIETRNLTKKYLLDEVVVQALRGVSLSFGQGEFAAIMGPSGSGKSTLLHLMGGIDTPTSGAIRIDGEDITRFNDRQLSDLRRDKIGFIFQTFNLIPTLTAMENVLVPLMPRGGNLGEADERAKELLGRMGLEGRLNHMPGQLSGGERQRVAIARALINRPKIVLADEPTGELDSKNGSEVMKILEEMHELENVTVIVVTHDPAMAALTHKTVYLHDGRIQKITERK